MRITLEIDDDVMLAARELARVKNQGVGRTISVWNHRPGALAVG